MLPSLVAEDLRAGLTSFLGTTFALGDDDVRAELERFVADPEHGVFRGPFVRLQLPFRPAGDQWRAHLDWAPRGFRPHRHQAQAWVRLASRDRIPRPTLVTTGTGSGKTESFLVPVLDHCRRQVGRPGIKALILYPMNALANDQARRLARLIHEHRDQLHGITAGLYTGDSDRAVEMTETAVLGDKHAMRRNPPDILLTNYKMLDMLLLRSEDAPLFANAGESLRYLVLDEFHTYDGAQGTDVAMLLRRLGMALGVITDEQPLGTITPVATSATLGGGAEGGAGAAGVRPDGVRCGVRRGLADRRGPGDDRGVGHRPAGTHPAARRGDRRTEWLHVARGTAHRRQAAVSRRCRPGRRGTRGAATGAPAHRDVAPAHRHPALAGGPGPGRRTELGSHHR